MNLYFKELAADCETQRGSMTLPCLFNAFPRQRSHTITMTITTLLVLLCRCSKTEILAWPSLFVCAIAYAILIIHIWPVTRDYEKNWYQISPIKPCISPDRWAFLCCLLGLYFFGLCLLGWTVCRAGIISNGSVTGTHLIWCLFGLSCNAHAHTHTGHHTQTRTHTHTHAWGHSCRLSTFLSSPLCSF